MIVTSTFKGILDSIANDALNGANILFEQRVVDIRSTSKFSGIKSIEISTSRGITYSFDGVVVTTPLGWLKRNQAAFLPTLDDRILKAIDSVSVGHLEKVRMLSPYSDLD